MVVNTKLVRARSLREAQRLGYTTNEDLPLLDPNPRLRSLQDATARILCMNVVVRVAYGLPKAVARRWLLQEQLSKHLSEKEQALLKGRGDEEEIKFRIQGIWTLGWALGAVPKFDFAEQCSDDLVTLLPDVEANQPADSFTKHWALRSAQEILEQCDLAYCLHWAIRDASLHRKPHPGKLHAVYVIERRRALEWLVGTEDYDSVPLDT